MTLETNETKEVTLSIYQEVCKNFQAVDDFRAKLLGFLPLASGGVFLLLGDALTDSRKRSLIESYLLPIGTFGFLITLGLFVYELRGIRRCAMLIKLGKRIEASLGVVGQFRYRSSDNHLKIMPSFLKMDLSVTLAARIIYSTTLAAWSFFIVFNSSLRLWIAGMIFLFCFIVSFSVLDTTIKRDFEDLDQKYKD